MVTIGGWRIRQSGMTEIIMKTSQTIFISFVLLITTAGLAAVTNDITAELQKGLFEEEANHNLEAAIAAYQSVIAHYDKDRKLAATAIFRLAESFRKEGKTNEASVQYERVLREFPDQSTLTTLSSQNLIMFGKTLTGPGPAGLSAASRQEQKRLYEEEIKLAEKQLENQQMLLKAGKLGGPDDLIPAQRDLLELKRKLAALDSGLVTAEAGIQQSAALTSSEAEEVKRIQEMIKNSPDLINARNFMNSATPLHKAAGAGQLVVAEFLLKNGAEIEAKDANEQTPMHWAANAGRKGMAELLIKYKANVQAADRNGNTPLHLAAENAMQSVAELLLENGADINAMNSKKATPLHVALANSFDSVAMFLIDHNADLSVVASDVSNRKGAHSFGTPLHVAATL